MGLDPSRLHILCYPDPRLRQRALPVGAADADLRALAARMTDLMREADGIGLAATQVGVPLRVFVAHVPEGEGRPAGARPALCTPGPVVYVNPVLSHAAGPLETYEEGCLSLPDIHGDVIRPTQVTIGAQDLEGQPFTQTASGLLARCWQHECDHLDGVLIIDRMTQLSRMRNRAALREMERAATSR